MNEDAELGDTLDEDDSSEFKKDVPIAILAKETERTTGKYRKDMIEAINKDKVPFTRCEKTVTKVLETDRTLMLRVKLKDGEDSPFPLDLQRHDLTPAEDVQKVAGMFSAAAMLGHPLGTTWWTWPCIGIAAHVTVCTGRVVVLQSPLELMIKHKVPIGKISDPAGKAKAFIEEVRGDHQLFIINKGSSFFAPFGSQVICIPVDSDMEKASSIFIRPIFAKETAEGVSIDVARAICRNAACMLVENGDSPPWSGIKGPLQVFLNSLNA